MTAGCIRRDNRDTIKVEDIDGDKIFIKEFEFLSFLSFFANNSDYSFLLRHMLVQRFPLVLFKFFEGLLSVFCGLGQPRIRPQRGFDSCCLILTSLLPKVPPFLIRSASPLFPYL